MVPIDLLIHEGLGGLQYSILRGTYRCGRALTSAAGTLVKQVVFAEVPTVSKTVLTDKLIAGLFKICKALKYVRAKQAVLVIDNGSWALMATLGLEFHIQWDQGCSCFVLALARSRWMQHTSHIDELKSVSKDEESLHQTQVSIETLEDFHHLWLLAFLCGPWLEHHCILLWGALRSRAEISSGRSAHRFVS